MARNEVDVTVESDGNDEQFARISVKSQVGAGTDNRHTVKGTLQRETLEEVEAERDTLVANVKAAAQDALEAGSEVREAVLDDE